MIVHCEKCRAQFDVDDDVLRPSGRKLKCSQCQAIFFQKPPPPTIPKEVPPPIQSPDEEQNVFEKYEDNLSDFDELFPDESAPMLQEGLEPILVEDAFGPLEDESDDMGRWFQAPEEISAEEALGGLGGSFLQKMDDDQIKDGLINTYNASAAKIVESGDEDATILARQPALALAKPTQKELEKARLAEDALANAKQAAQEKFVKIEPTWDIDESAVSEEDDEEEEEVQAEEDSSDEEVKPSFKKYWLMAALLFVTLGLGLTAQTDWWTFKRFDWFSSFRFDDTHGEWRRYPFGMVLLVSGAISNTSRTVQTVPGIRVVLMDENGKEVGSTLGYPGRTIEDKLLDESSETVLRAMAELQGEEKRLKINKLMPGNTIPFQIVFVKPVTEASRFRMELLHSANPLSDRGGAGKS
ncbi:MAG: zinc-ribbon domain-containing protein [Magnetococcales bacterium]|nr:zinc-ribbon domain-containing protein [Magnetococcales bacterium]